MLFAPRVLLRRAAGDLRERLAKLAKHPQAVEQAFWQFANEEAEDAMADADDDDDDARNPSPALTTNWPLIERVAAQAPAKGP